MKRHEIALGAARLPLEAAAVFGCFFMAQKIRGATDLIPGVQLPVQVISPGQLAGFAAAGAVLAAMFLLSAGLYRIRISGSRMGEASGVVRAMTSWFFAYIGVLYLTNGYVYSTPIPRLVVFFAFLLSVVAILFLRTALNVAQDAALARKLLEKRKAVLVTNGLDAELASKFEKSRIYDLAGYFAPEQNPASPLPWLGAPRDAEDKLDGVDDLFYAGSDLSEEDRLALFEATRIRGVRYSYFPNVFEADKRNVEMHFLGKTPVVEIKSVGLDAWGRVIKRATDVAGASVGVAVLAVPMALLLMCVWLRDGGNPIYRSVRVGKGGKTFSLYKVRTMVPDAENLKRDLKTANERTDGPLFKMEKDPRVTRLGAFLRKTGLDELPQLWNVLAGDMSLVGPRPHLPDEVKKYRPHQTRVLTVKPGITGMAQVHGRHRNSFDREVELDTLYIENWSPLLDAKILAKTFSAAFGKGA